MQWFNNLKIRTKLFLCFAAVLICTAGGFGVVGIGLYRMQIGANDVALTRLPSSVCSTQIKASTANLRMQLMQHILSLDSESMRIVEAKRRLTYDELISQLKTLQQLSHTDSERLQFEKLSQTWESYYAECCRIIELSRSGKKEEATLAATTGKSPQLYNELREVVDQEILDNEKGCEVSYANSESAYSSAITFLVISLVVSCLISSAACMLLVKSICGPIKLLSEGALSIARGGRNIKIDYTSNDEIGTLASSVRLTAETVESVVQEIDLFVRSAQSGDLSTRAESFKYEGVYRELVNGLNQTFEAISQPIDEAVTVLTHVSDRNLTSRVTGNYLGQFNTIKSSLNKALDCLTESLSQVAVGAEQVNSASSQIANGSQSLAQGASDQASTLAHISSSMEQMLSATKQSADNAAIGRTLAEQSQASVEQGSIAMKRMAESIGKIKASSDATAKIIKTIDDIAFQTNLLALNAAVEAARAGDAGKGFAVVAEEVRNLAQRSAEAAKNTSQLIEESVKNSEGGVSITNEMSQILAQINVGSRKVNDIIAEIAAATREQSSGIDNVNAALTNLDKLVQVTAANSEESAAAGEQLNAQASSLANTVGAFRLNHRPTQTASALQNKVGNNAPKKSTVSQSPKPFSPVQSPSSAVAVKASKPNTTQRKVLVPLDDDDFSGF